mgnify:CR=1 FL=1
MKVRYLASTPPITAPPETPIREVASIMAKKRVGLVVLTRGEDLVGVVSERDVVRAVAEDRDMGQPAETVATRHVVTIEADADVKEAASLFRRHNVRHLVVMDKGRVFGVLSIRDIVKERELLAGLEEYAAVQADSAWIVGD